MISRIVPVYFRQVRSVKSHDWEAQIPNRQAEMDETPWPVNKTICIRSIEPWDQSLSNSTIRQLYAWCNAKNLSLLEYGFCIVSEQQGDVLVEQQLACFRFKKLKHAFIFKMRWEGTTHEIDKEL